MKRALLGFGVALAAFFGGVLTVGIFRVENKPAPLRPAAKIQYEEVKTKEIPTFRLGQLEQSKTAEAEEVETKTVDLQGFYGWYSPDVQVEKMPEINMILLSADDLDDAGNSTGKIKLHAGIFTKLDPDIDKGFTLEKWAPIDDNKVKFETKKLKGIVYRFEGVFFKNKTTGDSGEKLLRGTLQKFIKGRKIAEFTGDFAYYEPHCWH